MTDGNDPNKRKEAQNLKPNEDTRNQEERDNILEREFGGADERDLDKRERQHRPLTEPEDDAKVDRVVVDRAEDQEAVPTERSYLMSPTLVRNLFVGSSIAAVLLIVVILTLASAANRARYAQVDETQYERTLTEATEAISGYRYLNYEGRQTASIPINEAMTLLAERGLQEIDTAIGSPGTQAQGQQDAAQEGAQPGGAQAQQGQAEQDGAQQGQPPGEAAQAGGGQAGGGEGSEGAPAAGAAVEVLTAGQAAYEANCASCHQATGQGVPGAFPPLVGHVPELYNAQGGHDYLINLLLYGLQGEIQVEGQTYNGVMPAWQQLSDEEIASILNYTATAWGNNEQLQNFEPYEAADITPLRDAGLSAQDVYNLRQELGLGGE